ncbi:MAG: hypothetical protein KF730_05750 [Sphingomonas sp.]|uniref:hypothetical protein n=1 Tax=Sphingomonas sp. TaxID=28214 RepID=UPI0025DE0E18|nr:hypothetical protein [Sphingomonas sp.]MBX3564066.1 hypothetical protein [Sphingomonas sp.]
MGFWSGLKESAVGAIKIGATAATAGWRFTISRGYDIKHLVTGEMNYDISRVGKTLAPSMLRPGDVMVKQGAWREWDDLKSYGIMAGQAVFGGHRHRYAFAYLLGHAAIFTGKRRVTPADGKTVEGDMAESISNGVELTEIGGAHNRRYAWYVIRPKRADIAQHAVETALATVGKVDYSLGGALWGGALGGDGINGMINRITRKDPTAKDRNALANKERAAMFCSEFVAFSLNSACDAVKCRRYFDAEQNTVTPEELYVGLRDNPDWEYVGEVRPMH